MERVKIAFVIPGVPIAQPRQRSRVACINGHTVTQNYTPTKHPVNTFKAAAKMAAEAAYCGEPLSAPLDVAITFVMPRPANMRWKKRPMPRAPFGKKPDADNLAKSVMDALNEQLWADDRWIVRLRVEKVYAAGDEQPRAEVVVETL